MSVSLLRYANVDSKGLIYFLQFYKHLFSVMVQVNKVISGDKEGQKGDRAIGVCCTCTPFPYSFYFFYCSFFYSSTNMTIMGMQRTTTLNKHTCAVKKIVIEKWNTNYNY